MKNQKPRDMGASRSSAELSENSQYSDELLTKTVHSDPKIFALRLSGAFLVATFLAACATVKVEPPSKPIEINLNVKIEGELRVKLDEEIETLIDENPDIF